MQKICTQCEKSRPLQLFRRFSGRKKILRTICNVCDPPRTLRQMTPAQRVQEVHYGRANPLVVSSMAALERAQRYGFEVSGRSTRVQAGLRRRAWEAAILGPLQKEIYWAEELDARYGHQVSLWDTGGRAERAGPRQGGGLHPDLAAPWRAFAQAYAPLLRRMLGDARAELARVALGTSELTPRFQRGAAQQPTGLRPGRGPRPRNPTPEQADPCTYILAHEIGRLRRLYAACQPIPGRRAPRSPWLLSWGDASPPSPTGEKTSPTSATPKGKQS